MRKFLIPAAVLLSTIAVSAPAAAQWAPNNGYANGYYQNQGQGRRLEMRVSHIRREIQQLDRRNILGNREARYLDGEARNLQLRIRQIAYNGINQRERYAIERQIANLEQRIRYAANDRNGRRGYGNEGYGNNNGYGNGGYNNGYSNGYNNYDRDRDGRDDRYEDDRGSDHDGRHDRDHD